MGLGYSASGALSSTIASVRSFVLEIRSDRQRISFWSLLGTPTSGAAIIKLLMKLGRLWLFRTVAQCWPPLRRFSLYAFLDSSSSSIEHGLESLDLEGKGWYDL